jgi:hypothetical protein
VTRELDDDSDGPKARESPGRDRGGLVTAGSRPDFEPARLLIAPNQPALTRTLPVAGRDQVIWIV